MPRLFSNCHRLKAFREFQQKPADGAYATVAKRSLESSNSNKRPLEYGWVQSGFVTDTPGLDLGITEITDITSQGDSAYSNSPSWLIMSQKLICPNINRFCHHLQDSRVYNPKIRRTDLSIGKFNDEKVIRVFMILK